MKKIIYSLVFTAALAFSTLGTKAVTTKSGTALMTGGDATSTITFVCRGSGQCYTGDRSIGSHIIIYGFPGDWVIVSCTPINQEGDEDPIEAVKNNVID